MTAAAVGLIDTSVFCEILDVPGRSSDHDTYRDALSTKEKSGEILLLPVTTILETGNHIGNSGAGQLTRAAAKRFVTSVRAAIDGKAPFTPTPMFEPGELANWLAEFPDWSLHGCGFGDLTIAKEWDRQCALNEGRRVYIWSLDQHLSGYDRGPLL